MKKQTNVQNERKIIYFKGDKMGTDNGTGWERNKRTHFDEIVMKYDKASAFHWVDAEIGCPKVFRLLKNGGTFALFRGNPVPADCEELYEEIQTLYNKHYNSYYVSKGRPVRISREEFLKPCEIYRGFRFESLERYGFSEMTMKLYDASQTYSADEYIALLDTFADHRGLPDDNRAALYAGIKEAILRHGGQHKVDYVYQLYMGRKL
jgi:hypothetical protein